MTASAHVQRTYLRTHIALLASVHVTPEDFDDALSAVNAARPSEIRREMARILRTVRHEWDVASDPPARRTLKARSYLVSRWVDQDIERHLDAAMDAARGQQ